jgi:hypothetical protein
VLDGWYSAAILLAQQGQEGRNRRDAVPTRRAACRPQDDGMLLMMMMMNWQCHVFSGCSAGCSKRVGGAFACTRTCKYSSQLHPQLPHSLRLPRQWTRNE